jgi:hypothetical protein
MPALWMMNYLIGKQKWQMSTGCSSYHDEWKISVGCRTYGAVPLETALM